MKQKLLNYLQAGFPALAIRTVEEQRAIAVVQQVAAERKLNCFVWNTASGICQVNAADDWGDFGAMGDGATVPDTLVLGDAAKAATMALRRTSRRGASGGGLLVFSDVHTWVSNLDPMTERWVKEMLLLASGVGATVLFIGPEFRLPASWEKSVACMDFELPDKQALDEVLAKTEHSYTSDGRKLNALTNGEREDALRAASGLTEPEAANAFALALIEGKAEKKLRVETVYREKAATVKRSGLMELIEPDPRGLDAIGGNDLLKAWILQRKRCYSKEAREYGLPSPRGVLLAGIPGCGKSLAAKCVGTALGVPTLRMDIGALMGGIVGQSEAQTRAALAMAEAVAPCVLQIEEVEKGLAGAKGSGDLDSGVGRRVLGTILSWLQDRKRDVFVFATANQVWLLPPELLRKGRFDEIFFLRLPSVSEREEIFRIHLEKRGRNPKKFNLRKLAEAAGDFTGSECEEAVISGMYAAFDEGKEVDTGHVVAACKATTPLARTMKEDIEKIEEWGKTRARPASSVESAKPAAGRQFGGGKAGDQNNN
jgi:SpoVK/Ycf46/Vps4 family AAA+-type ATPase